jgi:hypothetical protein
MQAFPLSITQYCVSTGANHNMNFKSGLYTSTSKAREALSVDAVCDKSAISLAASACRAGCARAYLV